MKFEIAILIMLNLVHPPDFCTNKKSFKKTLAFQNHLILHLLSNFLQTDTIWKAKPFYGFAMCRGSIFRLVVAMSTIKYWTIQCWTVATFFTFGHSQMFGSEKLRPSAVDRSQSRRINSFQTCYVWKVLIRKHWK